MTPPVLVIVKKENCPTCDRLNPVLPDIYSKLNVSYPMLDTVEITLGKYGGRVDHMKYPGGLSYYVRWFPTFLLVPGPIYKNALAKVGKPSFPDLKGVQVINAGMKDDGPKLQQPLRFNILHPKDIIDWITIAQQDPEFIRYQTEPISEIGRQVEEPALNLIRTSERKQVRGEDVCKRLNLIPAKR